MRILLLDNYDSFTYNLNDYLLQLGVETLVLRNDAPEISNFRDLEIDGIVLSPGPKRPSDAGAMMEIIDFYHDKLPILGICLGHQAIGEYFGCRLVKSDHPVHGKTSKIKITAHPIFKNIPDEFIAMRYHSLILTDIKGDQFEIMARTKKGEVMAIVHKTYPLTGIQFHPESILTEYGLEILNNWLISFVIRKPININFV